MTIDQNEHLLAIAKTKKQLSIEEVIKQDGLEVAKKIYRSRRKHLAATRHIRLGKRIPLPEYKPTAQAKTTKPKSPRGEYLQRVKENLERIERGEQPIEREIVTRHVALLQLIG